MARSGRRHAGEHRHADADRQRDHDRAGLEDGAAVGKVRAEGLEQLVERRSERDPAEQPEHAADDAQHQPFVDDRAACTCPREAPSVRSRPNSRVRWATVIEKVLKMMNAPTTSGDVGEDQQERAQEAQVAFQVGGVLRRLLSAGAHVDGARQHGADAVAQLARGDAAFAAATSIWS